MYLTQGLRSHIEAYKKAGYNNKEIAKNLKVHPSSISRELKRNSSPIRKRYGAASAQEMTVRRKSVNSKANKKLRNKLEELVVKYIKMDCHQSRYLLR